MWSTKTKSKNRDEKPCRYTAFSRRKKVKEQIKKENQKELRRKKDKPINSTFKILNKK